MRPGTAGRRTPAPRHGLDQRLQHVSAPGRVGRLQAIGHRSRAGDDRPGRVPRGQAHLAEHRARTVRLVRGLNVAATFPAASSRRTMREPSVSRSIRRPRWSHSAAQEGRRHDRGRDPAVGTSTGDDRDATKSTIEVRHLWKVFGPAEHKIVGTPDADLPREELKAKTGSMVAIRDVSFDVARRGVRGHGPVRLRQVDPGALPDPADRADRRRGPAGRRGHPQADDERLRELRRHQFSMVFQHFGLLPHRRVVDNVAYGLEIRGDRQGRAPRRSAPGGDRAGRADRLRATATRTSSPAACSSASAWPARWPSTPR